MTRFRKLFLVVAVMFVTFSNIAFSYEVKQGTAIVDGNISEWNVNDSHINLLHGWGKNGHTTVLATLYMRYDCRTNTIYFYCKKTIGMRMLADPDESWVKIAGNKLVDGNYSSFAWVNLINNEVDGWEASAQLAEGTYILSGHSKVYYDREWQTAGEEGKEITVQCPIANELTLSAIAKNQINVVDWQSDVEINHAGYNIYRSATENGIFVRLNDKLITTEYAVGAGHYQYVDSTATSATNYYKLEEVSLDGALKIYGPISVTTTDADAQSDLPIDYSLAQNYPNPFNPTTNIEFTLNRSKNITLKVYDVLGNEVEVLANGIYAQGQHRVQFDAGYLSNGIYFYQLQTDEFTETRRMMLMK